MTRRYAGFVFVVLAVVVLAGQALAQSPAPLPEGLTPEEKRDIDVFRRAQASVVFITAIALRRDIFTMDIFQIPQGSGSGFVWDRQGHIVTNFHVIQD
ncbi:MAG: serine protease, partial [Candidatus Rokubacteria bacterium]|nr:serine protease [Candidatus Rokubacteria bacterium]